MIFSRRNGTSVFSTDTGAVLRAIEIEADAMLAKAIDGIYDNDPKVNPEAVKYDEISIQEVIDQKRGGSYRFSALKIRCRCLYSV